MVRILMVRPGEWIVRAIVVLVALFAIIHPLRAQEAGEAKAPSPNAERDEDPSPADLHCDGGVEWTKVPPLRPLPRLGMAVFFPNGPGYYSLTDQLQNHYQEKVPNLPWGSFAFTPASAFDLDFRYLDKPGNTQHDFFDPVKRIHLGDDWLFSVGGQTWLRTMNEVDSRLTTTNNDYQLVRTRLYGDLWYRDQFRLFVEGLYAESFNFDLNPLPIDIDRGEFLNLFVDVKIAQLEEGSAYLRVGRQELLYGSQRLISPLEWANTRRTFQGIKGFYTGKDWDVDLFWVQPVLVNRGDWDSVDNNQNLFGAWATHKVRPGTSQDFYYLYRDNTNPTATGSGGVKGGSYTHTLGTRAFGQQGGWLYDVELMFQLGQFSNQDLLAASTPAGLGYTFQKQPWKPQLWVYYDWASGDRNPRQGNTNNTFDQLFPFGHYYFGYLDLVARKNIQDPYLQLVCFPENWLTLLFQYHNFWLAESRDALYNAAGVVLRQDPTGRAGNFVGNEIDLLLSAQMTRHLNFSIGWSKLFAGEFIRNTGPDVSPELLYMQVNYRW